MTRTACLGLAGVTVATGLLLRLPAWGLPLAVHHVGGGILWGAMLFLVVAASRPQAWGFARCAAAAFALAALIEASRLIHAAPLDAFRATLAGQLLLGRIFSGWNVISYGAGILLVAGPALALRHSARSRVAAREIPRGGRSAA